MSIFNQKGKREVKNIQNKKEEKELDLDALDKVTGGVFLRDIDKIKTTDVNDNTKSKVWRSKFKA